MQPNFKKLRMTTWPDLRMGTAALLFGMAGAMAANADENDARAILKSMSDYISNQSSIELTFDSDIEIITPSTS